VEFKSCLQAALTYRKWGWSVVACEPRGKKPIVAWKEFQNRLAEPDEIREWFRIRPDANLAVITGAISNLIVLDVDSEQGFEEIHARGGMDWTPCVMTSKGMHFYFSHPGHEIRNFAKKIPGLDLRGDGGYVLAPPSVHPDGPRYTWQELQPRIDGLPQSLTTVN